MHKGARLNLLFLCLALGAGCSHIPATDVRSVVDESLPLNWSGELEKSQVQDNWLSQFTSPALDVLIQKALSRNQSLRQQYFAMAIKEQNLTQDAAALLPELDFSLRSGRSYNNRSDSYANTATASLNLDYELDIWGKLSAKERQSELDYLAARASYQQARQQLVADVLTAWFDLVAADKLLDVYNKRVKLAKENLAIIESGYRSGLNEALDVYLTRNELNTQLARVAQQEVNVVEAQRKLERLIGEYPVGAIRAATVLPDIDDQISAGVPSELLTRKPQLQSAWYQLLSRDAALAFAHKQRFPSLNLSASLFDSTQRADDLFSPSSLAWSLLGAISAPIFNGGALAANEEAASLALKQQEQAYLATLYDAFSEVENGITRERGLVTRYQATLGAKENALAAEQLSFEQYQRGLVTYTTVLDAQARSFDAQSSAIELKNQLIANRIQLYVALGGDFGATANIQDKPAL